MCVRLFLCATTVSFPPIETRGRDRTRLRAKRARGDGGGALAHHSAPFFALAGHWFLWFGSILPPGLVGCEFLRHDKPAGQWAWCMSQSVNRASTPFLLFPFFPELLVTAGLALYAVRSLCASSDSGMGRVRAWGACPGRPVSASNFHMTNCALLVPPARAGGCCCSFSYPCSFSPVIGDVQICLTWQASAG